MLKRFFDVMVSVVLLIFLLPIFIILSVFIYSFLGSPIIFSQVRAGYQEQPFRLFKFRTMTDERDVDGNLLPDEVRLTPFGRFLRSTSLDELPGLWNVLKGDMSLVGPRPLLMEYLPLYSTTQRRRHDVLPGITGWAQINGRNLLSWEDKFNLDVWYVDHASFILDLKILFLTILKVLKRNGVETESGQTPERFTGTV